MNDLIMMCYYGRPNDDVFLTCLNSLRSVSNTEVWVYADSLPDEWRDFKNVRWIPITPEQYMGRRCLFKMELVQKTMESMADDDRLIVADADLYFLDDPFRAFNKLNFDIGVTRRINSYKYSVNGGLFFINVNEDTRKCFGEYFNEYKKGKELMFDWFLDQKFLCDIFEDKYEGVVDVGWEYNFCPNTDIFGTNLAVDMIKRAYESNSVKVLHLKSELKLCVYSGFLKYAITKYSSNCWNWKDSDTLNRTQQVYKS